MDKTKPVEYNKKRLHWFLKYYSEMPFKEAVYEMEMYLFIARTQSDASVAKEDALFSDSDWQDFIIAENKILEAAVTQISEKYFGSVEAAKKAMKSPKFIMHVALGKKGGDSQFNDELDDLQQYMSSTRSYFEELSKSLSVLHDSRLQFEYANLANAWKLAYMMATYRLNDTLQKLGGDTATLEMEDINTLEGIDNGQISNLIANTTAVSENQRRAAAWYQFLQLLSERLHTTAVDSLASTVIENDGVLERITREGILLQQRVAQWKVPAQHQKLKTSLLKAIKDAQALEHTDYRTDEATIERVRETLGKMQMMDIHSNVSVLYQDMVKDTHKVKG